MTDNCRFCKANSLKLVFTKNDQAQKKDTNLFACTNCGFGKHGDIDFCKNCKIYYVDEKISQKQISTYYEVAQDPQYFAEQSARARTFKHYLNRLKKYKGNLLDIGTNTGLFVMLAQDASWEAQGLEPNRWAVKYAKEHYKIKLINKPFENNIFPKASFNVITMWDVIEHFTNPVSEIERVFKYLKSGGIFAFSTVDPDSLLAKAMGTKWPWYMEMHKVFFSQNSARYYLQKAGFKKIIFMPHFRFLSLGYLSSRLAAINVRMSMLVQKLVKYLGLSKIVVPYYANDLYDCYAFKD